ncbi:nuclear transport factor 2 family protein [Flavimarina sp. Hel_I_48]|uniref:nuclear transport factor 2 family protein n=1 Tax=Flavimarina sp. Hel_I_48 TaxID=1392488 RepID=UPI00068DB227|nr:nuclear transport factor 2 family protein [Flavimarina sp. Hel_I_48]
MRYSKIIKGLCAIFIVMISGQINAQDTETENEIKDLSAKKWQWMADKEADKLAELFHDKAQFVHMGGSWGKEQEVQIIKTGGIWYKKADIHKVSADIIENTAIVLSTITLLAVVGGNEVSHDFIVTEVYVKEDTSWKLANLSFVNQLTGGPGEH